MASNRLVSLCKGTSTTRLPLVPHEAPVTSTYKKKSLNGSTSVSEVPGHFAVGYSLLPSGHRPNLCFEPLLLLVRLATCFSPKHCSRSISGFTHLSFQFLLHHYSQLNQTYSQQTSSASNSINELCAPPQFTATNWCILGPIQQITLLVFSSCECPFSILLVKPSTVP